MNCFENPIGTYKYFEVFLKYFALSSRKSDRCIWVFVCYFWSTLNSFDHPISAYEHVFQYYSSTLNFSQTPISAYGYVFIILVVPLRILSAHMSICLICLELFEFFRKSNRCIWVFCLHVWSTLICFENSICAYECFYGIFVVLRFFRKLYLCVCVFVFVLVGVLWISQRTLLVHTSICSICLEHFELFLELNWRILVFV